MVPLNEHSKQMNLHIKTNFAFCESHFLANSQLRREISIAAKLKNMLSFFSLVPKPWYIFLMSSIIKLFTAHFLKSNSEQLLLMVQANSLKLKKPYTQYRVSLVVEVRCCYKNILLISSLPEASAKILERVMYIEKYKQQYKIF